MSFDRWAPYLNNTISYFLFRHDEESLNDYIWNSMGLIVHAEINSKKAHDHVPICTFLQFGSYGNRSCMKNEMFKHKLRETGNWSRLSSALLMASYLESYIRRSVRLSIESDPGILIGKSKVVDGVEFLKNGTMPDDEISLRVERCTKGEWDSRLDNFKSIFGKDISRARKNISDLRFLQSLRNSIAHEFAYAGSNKNDLWYLKCDFDKRLEAERLSPERFLKIIKVVAGVSKEIDNILMKHIGCYEILNFWHGVQSNIGKRATSKKYKELHHAERYGEIISHWHFKVTGGTVSRSYANSVISFYNSL